MENVPVSLSLAFGLITAATVAFLYVAVRRAASSQVQARAKWVVAGALAWLGLQAFLAGSSAEGGVYQDVAAFPPRLFVFGLLPALVGIAAVFATTRGRQWVDSLSLPALTYMHGVRVFVELVLYGLFVYKAVPGLMTFEGRNFDILAGITGPLVAYFGLQQQRMSRKMLLLWNALALGLLANIVIHAILSAPFPLQQLAFDQPNIAVLHFPFVWLPTFVVPAVLFSHLVAIRRLRKVPF